MKGGRLFGWLASHTVSVFSSHRNKNAVVTSYTKIVLRTPLLANKSRVAMSSSNEPGLVTRILRMLLVHRGQHQFRDWFSDDDLDLFKSGHSQLHTLEPFYQRYQSNMERELKEICEKEGVGTTEEEIIAGLENARDESDEWKQLDILIKSLTDPAIFYKMMTRRADRRANKLKQRFEGLKSSKEKRK